MQTDKGVYNKALYHRYLCMCPDFVKNMLLGLFFTLVLANLAIADERHYPSANQMPIKVGTEEYMKNYASLAGLEGVHVVTKFVIDAAKKYEFSDMKTDLKEQIEKRFNAAGLRMLKANEVKTTPGQPTLSFFTTYTGEDIDAIKARTNLEEKNSDNSTVVESDKSEHDCCRSSIWASFQQSSTILRAPNRHFKMATWGQGEDSDACENRGAWTYDAVLKVVDKFIEDYQKAQSELGPKLVSTVTEAPKDCAQAWLMNLNVFETDNSQISDAVKPILDELADAANRCENYSYVIETHADQRANKIYNKILSEARAHAIKEYLLRKNISDKRLKTMALGESKPLTNGTTELDHALNRRVVIIPQLDKS